MKPVLIISVMLCLMCVNKKDNSNVLDIAQSDSQANPGQDRSDLPGATWREVRYFGSRGLIPSVVPQLGEDDLQVLRELNGKPEGQNLIVGSRRFVTLKWESKLQRDLYNATRDPRKGEKSYQAILRSIGSSSLDYKLKYEISYWFVENVNYLGVQYPFRL